MDSPIIDIQNFSFSIGDTKILDSVSLHIFDDEYLSIIGPNGAGKTTLLKCLMRIYTGGQGTIVLNGRSIERYSRKELARLISYVPQSIGNNLPFTVEEFVMMGRYPHLSPFTTFGEQDRNAVRDALSLTGMEGLENRHLSTLSGGERQTIYIAAALAQGARIMLLDEPTAFLDPKHGDDIHRILRKIKEEAGVTIISVTHNINSAALESDRVAVLKNGKVVFSGNAPEIMTNEVLEPVYGKTFTFVDHPVTGSRVIIPESSEQ
ncbi:ABC transporter ATP-binding protein [Candidatus Omnitrophota bacterium]